MKREIKFRAWDRIVNGFIDSSNILLAQINNPYSVVEYDKDVHFYHEMRNIELTQFTGLFDRLGKEIYEGDIVKIKTGSVYDKQLFTIGFRMGSFEMQAKNDLPPLSFIYMAVQLRKAGKITKDVQTMDHIEVIGNIYENSELINN